MHAESSEEKEYMFPDWTIVIIVLETFSIFVHIFNILYFLLVILCHNLYFIFFLWIRLRILFCIACIRLNIIMNKTH